MNVSKFRRPAGFAGLRDDPEGQYRAGFQHGAVAVLELVRTEGVGALDDLRAWIETDLQIWRHDTNSDPKPPDFKRSK